MKITVAVVISQKIIAPSDLARAEWLRLRKSILRALKFMRGSHTESELLNGVIDGRYGFYTAPDAFILTNVERYQTQVRVDVFLAGGNLFRCLDLIADAEKWAKSIGASEIRTSVRPALDRINDVGRHAPEGWKRSSITYVKDLRDGR